METRAERRIAVGTAGFAVMAVGLTFSSLVSASRIPFYRDLTFFFVPFKQMIGERLRSGDVALWNPHVFLGTPLLADLHSGALYPPSVFLLLPFPAGFNSFLLFHYGLALAGVWLFLRVRGAAPIAAGIGSLTFVIGGFSVSMLNVTNFLQSFAWVPWTFWAWLELRHRPSGGRFSLFAVVVAMQTLAGGVEIQVLTVLLLGAWTLVESRAVGAAETLRREAALILGCVLALGLVGAQVIPTAELVSQTSRGSALDWSEVSMRSMQPISLFQLLLPHSSALVSSAEQGGLGPRLELAEPWLASLYLGLVPLCAVVAGCAASRERHFWTLVGVAGVMLALGKNAVALPALYEVAPWFVGKFRYPEKLFFLTHVAATVLAADGIDELLRRDSRAIRAFVAAVGTFLAILGAFCAFRWWNPLRFVHSVLVLTGDPTVHPDWVVRTASDLYFKALRAVGILSTLAVVLALRGRSLIGEGIAVATVIGLVAADLGSTHHDMNLSLAWGRFAERSPVVDVAELQRNAERVLHVDQVVDRLKIESLEYPLNPQIENVMTIEWARLFPNSMMVRGVGTPGGGEALRTHSIETLIRLLAALPTDHAVRLLGALSVRYLLGRAPISAKGVERVEPTAPDLGTVYRVTSIVPRLYLARRAVVATNETDAVNRLLNPSFVFGEDAVVEERPEGFADAETGSALGSASLERYENERVVARVNTSQPALLVLNDSFFPGWRAWIGDREAPIVRANQFARGVWIDAGEHRVEFRYEPASFRAGVVLSVLSLAILLMIAVKGRRRP